MLELPAYFLWKDRQGSRFDITKYCFQEQLDFIRNPARFKTAVCSRRSGKTIACAVDLLDTALSHSGVVCLYITLSRKNAKRIIWPELLKLNTEYNLGGKPNETELTIKLPNGSIIYISGAKDKSEIENYRGLPIKKVYIDETQSFRHYIQDLVDDVLSKALFDYNGTLCLIGTPGLVPAGYFYDCAHSGEWHHSSWTMFQNPHLERKSGKTVQALVEEDCKRMGVGIDHPKIQRECYGRWVVDTDSLVFKYDASKCDYAQLPPANDWEYVIGVDLGYDDADAISVIGWNPQNKEAYLVAEDVRTKQGITELAARIGYYVDTYDPISIVMDTGGLGKKISEEIQRKYSLGITPAEKSEKFAHIEMLNDAMRTGKFRAKRSSKFAQDCNLVEYDLDKSSGDKYVISDRYHSDICFVAGTPILTFRGEVPIESVSTSDLVLTRQGWQNVEASTMTSPDAPTVEVTFTSGRSLRCTPNHKIWTVNRGWCRADALTYADRFYTSEECLRERPWSSKASSFIVTPRGSNPVTASTSTATLKTVNATCTKPYGKPTSALSPEGITFTTRMGMWTTTVLKTWNSLLRLITLKSTPKPCVSNASIILSGWRRLSEWLRLGTLRQRVLHGIENMLRAGRKRTGLASRLSAQYAGLSMRPMPNRITACFIVPGDVGPEHVGTLDWTTLNASAPTAQSRSWSTSSRSESTVVGLAQLPQATANASVYNLTVSNHHEYFAAGVLVKNCDSVLYAFRQALHWLYEEPKKRPTLGSPEWARAEVKRMEDEALRRYEEQKADVDFWADPGLNGD